MSDLATLVDSLTKEVSSLKAQAHVHAHEKPTTAPALVIPTAEVFSLIVHK